VELHEHQHPVGPFAVLQREAARVQRVADGPDLLLQSASCERAVRQAVGREAAPLELPLDEQVVGIKSAIQSRNAGGAVVSDERCPPTRAVEGPFDARQEWRDFRREAALGLVLEQPGEGVSEVPFAEVELGVGPGALQAGDIPAAWASQTTRSGVLPSRPRNATQLAVLASGNASRRQSLARPVAVTRA